MRWNIKSLHFPELPTHFPVHLLKALPGEKRMLGIIILLSALLHAAFFLGIHIIYPQGFTIHPAPAQVLLLSWSQMSSKDIAQRRFWESLHDPSALIVSRQPLLSPAEMEVTIRPHISQPVTSGTVTVALGDATDFLPSDTGSLDRRAQASLDPPHPAFHYDMETAASPKMETRLEWTPSLQQRLQLWPVGLGVQKVNLLNDAGVTVLRLCVGADGIVQHVLVEQSCGNNATDTVAATALRSAIFAPDAGGKPAWGEVTVFWRFEERKTTLPQGAISP